jgi:zinc transporter ZupT
MSLVAAALFVSLTIAVFCALPFRFPGVRRHSRKLLVVGTAVLFGFVFLDLVPEMFELGGMTSFALMLGSWILFTAVHLPRGRAHAHNPAAHGPLFLLLGMALHCFSGGMLLVASYEISQKMATAVLLSLLAHKAFEAVAVSSLLVDGEGRRLPLGSLSLYVLAFPLGVLLTGWARALSAHSLSPDFIRMAAMVITSLAVGGMVGCLFQDFLLPALRPAKHKPSSEVNP